MRGLFGMTAVVLLALTASTGCRSDGEPPAKPDAKESNDEARKVATMEVKSAAFGPGEKIPTKHTGEGEDVSPPLEWTGASDGVKSFALICDDPDAPRADPWVHWVAYDIAPDRTSLEEGVSGLTEGRNSWGKMGYGGPMPPPGHGVHHYHFKVYALDAMLDLDPGAEKEEVLKGLEGHVLAEGELVGLYER